MKLGHLSGWQRLWVLVSATYLIAVTAVTYLELQSAETKSYYSHDNSFYAKLKPESLSKLAVSRRPSRGDPLGFESSIWFVDPDDVDTNVQMPNGHVLPFRKGVAAEQMRSIAQEYLNVAQQAKPDRRASIIGYAALAWIVPCVGLYFLGWGIGWVHRGFKKGSQASR